MQFPLLSVNFCHLKIRGRSCSSRTMAKRGMGTCARTHTHTCIQMYVWIFLYAYRGSPSKAVRASQLHEGPRKQEKRRKTREEDNITAHSAPSAPSQDSDRLQGAHVPPSLSERPVLSAEVLIKPTRFFGIKERKADVELNWQPFRKS